MLDQLLILSEGRLYRVIKEYVAFFNAARPHQGINQKIPERNAASGEEKGEGKIIAFPVLNGLHNDYRGPARGGPSLCDSPWMTFSASTGGRESQ